MIRKFVKRSLPCYLLNRFRLSKCHPAPVHQEVDARHELARQVGGQEEHGTGDVRGAAQPRDRCPRFAVGII